MNALALAAQPSDVQDEQHPADKLKSFIDDPNIADKLDDETLTRMGERVFKEYQIDKDSRADWEMKTKDAMDLALQVAKEKAFPWPKAANIIYPLLSTASMQFAARAYPAIVNGRNVVRGVVIGDDNGTPQVDPRTGQPAMQQGPQGPMPVWAVPPGAKQMRADGIGDHMSWQLLDEMPEWEPDTDRLLHILPIVGLCPRKTYFDPAEGRNCSTLVLPLKLVVNFKAKSYETAPRLTEELEYYPNEIREMELSGLWREPPMPYGMPPEGQNGDDEAPHLFLEQHRYWDLDGDGYKEPYIVTIHKETRFVVRIVARFEQDGIKYNRKGEIGKIEPIHYYTLYGFIPNPESAVYPLGFGQLLRPLNEGINTVLNQLLDAGTLQNAGGGFIGKGLSMNAGAIRFQLGEYKAVNVTGTTVRDNIIPLDFKGPSPVLFELLGFLVEAGKEIASIKDVLQGDQQGGPNVPATTTLALIEQGLKTFTAIYKRVHRALKAEFDKLYRLNRVYGDERSQYKVGDTWKVVLKQDYILGSGVEPVSDPTMVSDMQRMGRAQFLMQMSGSPFLNQLEIIKRVLQAADIDRIDSLINPNPQPNPEIAAKGMELEIEGHKMMAQSREIDAKVGLIEAQRIQAYSAAIKNLADADATVGAEHLQWLDQNLRVWEAQFEAATQPTKNADGTTSAPGQGPPPPNLPHPRMPQMPNGGGNTDNEMANADPDGNGRVSPSAAFAATNQS